EEALLATREDEAVAAIPAGEGSVLVHRFRPPAEGRTIAVPLPDDARSPPSGPRSGTLRGRIRSPSRRERARPSARVRAGARWHRQWIAQRTREPIGLPLRLARHDRPAAGLRHPSPCP